MPVFLFTDIEGSTERWVQYPRAMEEALPRHDALLESLIARHGGQVIKNTGDGYFAVFEGGEPLACAIALQQAITAQDWSAIGDLRVRIALHTGEARRREDDYFGLEVSRTARLLSAGWGGQILLSCELARTATLPPNASLRDLGNHLLKDLSEPQHIFQLLHPDIALHEFPPLRTLSAHPHNLPPQPTTFVGRTEELREIALRMADPACRLLTLMGPGGMGKTRLALQAAAEHVEAFPNGVFFVPLAELSAPEQLVSGIAEALRITFYQRDAPRSQLLNYLREKRLLLVLDNFEHILEGALLVADILAHAPGVKVLVTSRERLNLREEQVYPVGGMSFPEGQTTALESYSAVQLFLQHAQLADPEFQLDAARRDCVAHICARVMGMPLALELAASWLRVLSCAEVAAEVDRSLDFLSTTQRDRPDRHRSLRAVFEYSWQLLTAQEQDALSAWAVFQSSFRREAAAMLLTAVVPSANSATTLALLAALVDKSLLQRRHKDRYAMHALLHQYALEKLQAMPQREVKSRQNHCAYYAAFLQQQELALIGAAQGEVLESIAGSFEDVRAAWQWAVQQGDLSTLRQAAPSLTIFLSMHGRNLEGIRLMESALEMLQLLTSPEATATRGQLLVLLASLVTELNHHEQARSYAETALAINRELGTREVLARTLSVLCRVAWSGSDYATAATYAREALELYEADGNLAGQAVVHGQLGMISWTLGEYDMARSELERSLELHRSTGNPTGIANCLDHLGVVARDTGDHETARRCFQESYERFQNLGIPLMRAYVTNHLGGAIAQSDGFEKAIPYFEQSIALGQELGERRIVAYTRFDWSSFLLGKGDLPAARLMLEQSLASFQAVQDAFGSILTQVALAQIAVQSGENSKARQLYSEALHASREINNLRLVSSVLLEWGQMLSTTDPELSVAIFSFVQTLPADVSEVTFNIGEQLASIQTRLAPEVFAVAQKRGQTATLEQIADRLLLGDDDRGR